MALMGSPVDVGILQRMKFSSPVDAYNEGLGIARNRQLLSTEQANQTDVMSKRARADGAMKAFEAASQGKDITTPDGMKAAIQGMAQAGFANEAGAVYEAHKEMFPQTKPVPDEFEAKDTDNGYISFNKTKGTFGAPLLDANKQPVYSQATGEKIKKEKADFNFGKAIPTYDKAISAIGSDVNKRDLLASKILADHPDSPKAERYIDKVLKSQPIPQGANPQTANSQKFQQENAIHDDYTKDTAKFDTALPAYAKLQQALQRNNSTDAYAAVINFVRTLDPGSTVREAEERLARERSSGGLWGQLAQAFSNRATGKMTDEVRKNLLEAGRGLLGSEHEQYTRSRNDSRNRTLGYPDPTGRAATLDTMNTIGRGRDQAYNDLMSTDIFKKSGIAPAAHPADDAMVKWAKENPTSPGAAEVLKANGL